MIIAKRVDIRYANALLQTAHEQNLDKEVYQDMEELRVLLLSGNMEFKHFLQNSVVKPLLKSKILEEMFKDKLNRLTLDFLQLILKKSRLNNVAGIIMAYAQLYAKLHNHKTITVYTAKELSEKQKKELAEIVSKQFPNYTIELRCRLYSKMIGGISLRYDDYLYDNSILTQLRNLRKNFDFNPHEPQF